MRPHPDEALPAATLPTGEQVVGLLPAGGQGTRIRPLPCSKELFPIGFRSNEEGQDLRPKVVSQYLLEKMRLAGIQEVYIVLRPGKWDIPTYFGDGSALGMHLAYLILGAPFGVPFTLDQAYPFVRNATVAFGFPDILFDPEDGFVKLLRRQSASRADITLGLLPSNPPPLKEDRVDFDDDGNVRKLILNNSESRLRYGWFIAVWRPTFTQFLHDYVRDKIVDAQNVELSAGHAIQSAIEAGLRVDSLVLGETPFLDIGTPDGLLKAVERSSREQRTSRGRYGPL